MGISVSSTELIKAIITVLKVNLPEEGFPWLTQRVRICLPIQEMWFNPWVGKIPRRRIGNSLQYSCLGNPKDRGAWGASVHGVTKELNTT